LKNKYIKIILGLRMSRYNWWKTRTLSKRSTLNYWFFKCHLGLHYKLSSKVTPKVVNVWRLREDWRLDFSVRLNPISTLTKTLIFVVPDLHFYWFFTVNNTFVITVVFMCTLFPIAYYITSTQQCLVISKFKYF